MNNFNYFGPDSLEEALSLLVQYGDDVKCLAGGQSLLLLMREGLVQPEVVVDLTGIAGLDKISLDENKQMVSIGALATHRAVETSDTIARHFPVLPQAYQYLASPQVRNIGTIGGNLAHNAPGSDPPPILIALGAAVTVQHKDSTRTESVETFGIDYYETTLAEDEILTEISVPLLQQNESIAYQKFATRKTDVAIVSVAAWLKMVQDQQVCEDIRVGLSGVHATTVRATHFENAVRGEQLSQDMLKDTSHLTQDDIDPISDVHATEQYRREILPVAIQRVVTQAWHQARES